MGLRVWIPLCQSLVWPLFLGIIILCFRKKISLLLKIIIDRVEEGDSFQLGPVSIKKTQMGVEKDIQLLQSEENIPFPRTGEIQGGKRPIGTKDVTFPYAFPATPIVLISPVSKKPVSHSLSDVSTIGFTVYIWGEQGESVSDVSFNWIAYLRK